MLKINECLKNIPCIKCDNKKCSGSGDIGADCPFYHCENKDSLFDCKHCQPVKDFIKKVYTIEVE